MLFKELKPRKALNKAFLKVKPNRTDIEGFKTNLITLLDRTNDTESEEFHKNLVSDFLKDTYYKQNHFINTKGRNDLVIHNGQHANTTVGVILEAKKPTNKSEMIKSFAAGDSPQQMISKLNKKAFHELVLYYLRERITHKNLEVKHLVVTNINEWFIFDATLFDRLFAQNKNLVKQFTDFEEGRLAETKTDFFYKEIAAPSVEQILTTNVTAGAALEFTYFNIQDYQQPLRNNDKADDHQLIALFKLLSPEHLLKLPFINDSNSLDKRFYSELLHIIGLTETKTGGKKLIERNKAGERHTGSILEDAIIQLDSLDKLSRLDKPSQFGHTTQERLFNVALELAITWINRILFLKLLEAQLITYHKGDKAYAFLNLDKIKNYDDLNSLFFQVLARKYNERNDDVKQLFEKVPYLNSSLFEPTELEQLTLFISNLKDDKTLPILSSTVLKDQQGKKRAGNMPTLQYLFEFLDAYDFGAEGSEDIQEDNKTLINASVLGLIFEKINGYKDGSFFTPGFITMYMCRETIRKAVIQKFNETKKWDCTTIEDIYDKIEDRKEANDIVNSIKICDPAVGSGHFLVSALNEMIAVKNDLKILQDRTGKRLKEYVVEVVNDELTVTDEEGQLFEYKAPSHLERAGGEAQRIQETLFHEKQTIIENCLFGVDINPNSVKICRLRLWIELLKSAYYIVPSKAPSPLERAGGEALETLPNIDINIKCGNSLVSRFAIDADLKQALKKSKWTIDGYKVAVATYRNAENKAEKREMERLIADIKSDFRSEIALNDPKLAKLRKLSGDLFQMTNQQQLFELTKKEQADWNKKITQLTQETKKLETEIEEIKANKIFENAFEWRFEFPEVLNDAGDFVGFDVVIGNPPYITVLLGKKQLYDINESNYYKENFKTFEYKGNTYALFIEKGINLLKRNGIITYIVPNTLLLADTYSFTRKLIIEKSNIEELVNCDFKVFDEAEIGGTLIFIIRKNENNKENTFKAIEFKSYFFEKEFFKNIKQSIYNDIKSFKFYLDEDKVKIILKTNFDSIKYGDIVKIYQGIISGDNKKFIANEKINENYVKIYRGKDISPFKLKFSNNYLLFDKKQLWSNTDEVNFQQPKIISRQTSDTLIGAFDDENYFTLDSTHVHTLIDNRFELKYLLALFNSKFIRYIYNLMVQEQGRVFAQVKTIILKDIPIKLINIKEQNKLIVLVDKIIETKRQTDEADTTALEAQIDQLVYQLYELTEEEIKIVEGK